jgi:hypothetical protein
MKTKKEKKEVTVEFIQIPYQLIVDKKLSPMDRFVYGAIYFFANLSGGGCYASNRSMSELLCTLETTISRSLKKLEDRRYIIMNYQFPKTKKMRTEIIPLVGSKKVSKKAKITPPSRQVKTKVSDAEMDNTSNPGSQHVMSIQTTEKDAQKTLIPASSSTQLSHINDDITPPGGQEKEKEREYINRISKYTLFFEDEKTDDFEKNLVSLPDGKNATGEEDLSPAENLTKDEKHDVVINEEDEKHDPRINEAIALFLPYFPGDFTSKFRNAFAIPATRDAVEALLQRYDVPGIRELLRKYEAAKTDRFRPEAGTVFEFCTYKLAKIESFLAKSAGNLWAQRSISTPEQRADSDAMINKIIQQNREKTRRAKEEWEKTHPKT